MSSEINFEEIKEALLEMAGEGKDEISVTFTFDHDTKTFSWEIDCE